MHDSLLRMPDLPSIPRLHDQATIDWHRDSTPPHLHSLSVDPEFAELAMSNHRANFDLWHEEDLARDPEATDADIVADKHAIDRLNQRRNDLVESMDRWLLCWLENARIPQNEEAPLNSETPGLMLDRLSILALKIFHTREEAQRPSATQAHRARNCERLRLLEEQRGDLAGCLDTLWTEIIAGQRRFKLYRQLKMYNDPELNPVLYRSHCV